MIERWTAGARVQHRRQVTIAPIVQQWLVEGRIAFDPENLGRVRESIGSRNLTDYKRLAHAGVRFELVIARRVAIAEAQ